MEVWKNLHRVEVLAALYRVLASPIINTDLSYINIKPVLKSDPSTIPYTHK